MTEKTSAGARNCPPWCAGDEDQDDEGRQLHAAEWDGATHYEDGADWHALARAIAPHDQAAAPPAVQLAVYVDGQEIIVTLTPTEADDLSGALADSADTAREAPAKA